MVHSVHRSLLSLVLAAIAGLVIAGCSATDSTEASGGLGESEEAIGRGGCSSNADCNDDNPCTEDVCKKHGGKPGKCENTAKANGASCDDENFCTQTDTCRGGKCKGENPVVCKA